MLATRDQPLATLQSGAVGASIVDFMVTCCVSMSTPLVEVTPFGRDGRPV